MNLFRSENRIFITCPKFLSPYLAQEVEALGYTIWEIGNTGLTLQGTLLDCIRLNLQLSIANNVLYLIQEFKANSAAELYEQAKNMPWDYWIDPESYLTITSWVDNPAIDNTMFANAKLKDAIVDRIRDKRGTRPNSGPDAHKTVIHMHWKGDTVALYVDSSGQSLARHGYRKHPGLAPLQENLATALVMASGFESGKTFVNPMCGSGTLAIEAALLSQKRKPGLFKANYGFMHIMGYDEQFYEQEREVLRNQIDRKAKSKIIATDINPRSVDQAYQNAQTAGVEHMIEFEVCDFRQTAIPEEKGIVMFNPGYGERLGTTEELSELYKAIGDFMKQSCKGYAGFVFTGNPDLEKKIGLKASKKTPFYNSKIECRLLAYELYDGSKREPKVG